MNALAYEVVGARKGMPWFDEYQEHNKSHKFCKIYNDGGCYVAVPSSTVPKKKRFFTRFRLPIDDRFDELYLQALKENFSKAERKSFILSTLREEYPDEWGLSEFVERKLGNVVRNLHARKKRFRRKAFLNRWNYFVTFTYSDELQSEESFKKRLRKCLSNLHTRRGWLYMGVFERAPETGRLHFHAVMYIPDGKMVGEIYERRDYSTRQRKIQVIHPNTFFEENYGRNDFEELSDVELRRGNTMQYLLKYLEKTEERIIYSRGIPTDFYKEIDLEEDVVCEMLDFVLKLVLFDDVIDYETDVKQKGKNSSYFFASPLPS